MGRKSPYNGVKLKAKKIPIDLDPLFTEISKAYGNSENKDAFIVKLSVFVEEKRY